MTVRAHGARPTTLEVKSRKWVVDSTGVEIEAPVDNWIEIGIYAEGARPPGLDVEQSDSDEPFCAEKHRIRSGQQTITLTTARKPASRHRSSSPAERGSDV